MKSRAPRPRTADLFAAADAAADAAMPAAAMPAAAEIVRAPVHAAGVPQTTIRPRPRQLWYAAVFPQLPAEHSITLLQNLCTHALQFTSFVSIEPPNALLLEIKGSVKLFGSLATLHTGIDDCWRRLALPNCSATAPSTLAALWLARAGRAVHMQDSTVLQSQLAQLPIACTAWDGERLQTLRAMGITRVGELLRLPRGGLTRRLGAGVVADLDIALLRQPAPRRAFVPRPRFRERCDFESEIEHVAYLERAVDPLIGRCAQFLRERQAGIQTLQLKLHHREAPASRVRLGLASITGERRRLSDVLCQKLARLELKAPVRSMELISGSLRTLSAASLDAFAGLGAVARDTVPQLVERLRARLGEEAVYGVGLIAEHRPEAAWRRVRELRLGSTSMAITCIEQRVTESMPRPVWLLDEPLPLPEPEILEGPERIESGWWDGKGVARDYYIARQSGAGSKLWVFQERQSKRWYLHGVFA